MGPKRGRSKKKQSATTDMPLPSSTQAPPLSTENQPGPDVMPDQPVATSPLFLMFRLYLALFILKLFKTLFTWSIFPFLNLNIEVSSIDDVMTSLDNVTMDHNITTNSSQYGDLSDYDATIPGANKWGFWIKFISTPVIVLVGIIGNSLSVVVMRSKMLRNKSYSHYLCSLAFFDTLTLVIRLVTTINEYYLDELNKYGPFQNFTNFWCKIYNYIEHVSYLMSSWLIVLMAIERLIAVCFPFKKVIIRKQTGAAIGIIGVFVLVCLSQSFRLVMIEHVLIDQELKTCASSDKYMKIYSNLDVYFYSLTLTFVLPLIIVLSCNCLVLYQIFKIRQELKQKDKNSRHSRIVRSKNRTTCMLLAVSFTYIVTLLPLFALTVVIDICVKTMDPVEAFQTFLAIRPYLEVCVTISLLNYACNFFIYILSGKNFRFELRKMFTKVRKPKRSFTARSTREEFIKL